LSDNLDAIEKFEASVARKHHWSIWLSRFALLMGVLAVGIALIGAVGAGERWWGQPTGIKALTAAFFLALAVILFTLLVLFYYRKEGKRIFWACIAALVLAGGYVGAHIAVKHGSELVRRALLAVSILLGIVVLVRL
jgi:uncharacterized membrane protein YfcA